MNASNPARARRITPFSVIALLALVAVAAGLGWFFGRQASAPAGSMGLGALPATAATATTTTGAGDMRTMASAAVLANARSAAAANGRPGAAMLGVSQLSLEELKRRQALKQRQLEGSFASDPKDPNAAQVELAMLKSMEDPTLISDGIAPGNPEVRCHRGSCRISADFDSADDASAWAVNYVTMLGGQLSTSQPVFLQQPDGSVRLQLYGMRTR